MSLVMTNIKTTCARLVRLVMSPSKKKKKYELTPDKVKAAFDRLNKRATELSLELDDIAKFVREAVSAFVSDVKIMTDELAILVERVGELEKMALERKKETQ